MINVTAIGRVAEDSLSLRDKIASFRIVSSEVRKVKGTPQKFSTSTNVATFFQEQRERCAWLCDDALVAVEGTLRIRSYESNGSKKWVTEIVANVVQPLADYLDEPVEDVEEEEEQHEDPHVDVPF